MWDKCSLLWHRPPPCPQTPICVAREGRRTGDLGGTNKGSDTGSEVPCACLLPDGKLQASRSPALLAPRFTARACEMPSQCPALANGGTCMAAAPTWEWDQFRRLPRAPRVLRRKQTGSFWAPFLRQTANDHEAANRWLRKARVVCARVWARAARPEVLCVPLLSCLWPAALLPTEQ